MQSNVPLILSTFLLGLLCVSALVEHSLYGGWNRLYYTHGLPFVTLRIPLPASHPDVSFTPPPAARFPSAWIGSLVFQQIAPNTYGFRRQFFQPALLPGNVMHGMLHFDPRNGRLVLKSFLNVWIALLSLVLAAFFLLGPFAWYGRLLALAILALVIGTPLLMEWRRCVKLAYFAASAWTRIPGDVPSP
jgi:hypothetical protein